MPKIKFKDLVKTIRIPTKKPKIHEEKSRKQLREESSAKLEKKLTEE